MTNTILIFIISITLLALIALLASRREKRNRIARGLPTEEPSSYRRPEGCCGKHEVCEHDPALRHKQAKPTYFDDEELDRYCGTPPNKYNEEDKTLFYEVLYTLLPEDIKPWILSLGQRGITLPDDVRQQAHRLYKEQEKPRS